MVSEALQGLDANLCAEIALVLFVTVFIGVAIRAYFMRREESDRCAGIPLDDGDRRTTHV